MALCRVFLLDICETQLDTLELAASSTAPVILSEQSESKDLGNMIPFAVESVRRFFDFVLRTTLRMTDLLVHCNSSTL